jgi:hypothetical protein
MKALRDEKIISLVPQYIKESLGSEFTSIPPLVIQDAFQETSKKVPMIILLH